MTEPLTTPDVDLRDFPYMPLDVVRLRDSDTAIMTSGEGFRAAVLLWCAAWHQIPAASVPDDDRSLAHLAGFGRDIASWSAVREEALRGFIKCSDGRLYHKTIAEKALEAWEARKGHRERLEKARQAKAAKASAAVNSTSYDEVSIIESETETVAESIIEPETGLKGREGKGRDINISSSLRSEDRARGDGLAERLRDAFVRFYDAYPKHINRKPAMAKFAVAVKSGVDPERIIDAAHRFAVAHRKAKTEPRYIPSPDVWLNKARYDDEDLPQPAVSRAGPPAQRGGGVASLFVETLSRIAENEAGSEQTRNFEAPRLLPLDTGVERRADGHDDGGFSRPDIELLVRGAVRSM